MIIAEQTPQRVMDVRAKMYELLSHCIPPTVIIKVCTLNPPRVIDTFAEPFLVDCCRRGCGTSGRELEGGHHALGSDLREGIFNLGSFASIYVRAQETRMRLGNKKIYHLEAWVVKVMSLYKVRSS